MRISLFLLFVCVCQLMAVEAGAQSAEIKISQNSMTIRQLVKEIEAQTEYLVVFRDQDVDAERVVSFKTKSASVANYLEELSENANIGYRFDIGSFRKKHIACQLYRICSPRSYGGKPAEN